MPGRATERATDTPLQELRRRDRFGGDQHAEWRRAPDGYGFASDPWKTGEKDGPRMSEPLGDRDDNWDGGDWDE